jgi:polysaccharide biosynthesis transport protein
METTNTKANNFSAPEVKLHFLDYWRIIRIRKTVILTVFLLVTITTIAVTFILPKTYASLVRMKVEKDTPDTGFLTGERPNYGFDPYWIQTEFEKIQSKMILYPVISNLNLNRRWAEKFKEGSDLRPDITYEILKRKIDVSQSRNTALIQIQTYSDDPNEAAEISNAIAEEYKRNRLSIREENASRGLTTYTNEYAKQYQLVHEKQKEVDKLKEELGVSDADVNAGYALPEFGGESLRELERERILATSTHNEANTLYLNLFNLNLTNRLKYQIAVLTASPDQMLLELQGRLTLAEEEYAEASEGYGSEHPEVKRKQRILAEVRRQVDERLDGILEGLRNKVLAAKAKADSLQSDVDKAKKIDIETAIKRRPYFQAKRELETMMVALETLAKRIIQERVNNNITVSGIVEIIDKAEPSLRAVRPRKTLNIVLGVIFGLSIGVGLAFFIEYLDTSVKTIDDVERALQSPVLGVIPQNVGSLVEEGPDSPHAEAYRVLRTNILFSQKDPKRNTITVVSGGPGEGKSTTLFNLAVIFAQNQQRVLIVDSDLRRPSLHKIMKVSNSLGLTNFLLKQNTLEEVIQTSPIPTLDFLPSGKLPSSSLGILSSAQMKELIRDLKRRYDWVFFDSPPMMGVSDASILASEVDMVLQVIQYRRYPQPMTIRAKQMIEKVGGNLLGIVLNNISMASDENYYYYSGYYYDYYSKDQEEDGEGKESGRRKKGASSDDESKVEIKPKY